MDRIDEQQKIASFITKEILGTITQAEAGQLSDWLNADEKHQEIYWKIKSKDPRLAIQVYERIDIDKGLKKYRKRYPSTVRLSLVRRLAVAAIVMLLAGIGISLLFQTRNNELTVAGLQPGSSKALLILDDGSVHELAKPLQEEVIYTQGVTVQNDGNAIQYIQPSDSLLIQASREKYNTLKIPTGGEYMLIMADGTKVWLNSQTTLRYPVSFSGQERIVELEGEAYFEVAKDTSRPFYVKTQNDIRVRVWGTSFNVRSYSDEEEIETVLEEGAVSMFRGTESVALRPGTRAVYHKQHNQFHTETVNTELYTAWRSGQYIFEEETIEHILHKLSRWYDMNVFFADHAVRQMIFSGNIRKYDTIQNLLNAIEATGGVHFEIKDNTVIVSRVSNN